MKGSALFRRCLIPAAAMLLWWAGSAAKMWNSYILPSPEQVWNAFAELWRTGELAVDTWASVRRVLRGFSCSFTLAFVLGALSARSKRGEFYGHVVEFLRHVPPLSLVPLLILWFGIGERSKTVLIVLASFFPVYMSVYKGFHGADKKLVEVGRTLGLSRRELFWRIEFPCAVPDVLSGLRIGLGYSWRAIISAEMIAAASGLGCLILDAQQMSRSDRVMAGIFVIGAIGWLSDAGAAALIGRVVPGGRKNG